ncbi:hypothetical protein UFOVP449_120 [uncultured Caudovirales phage]|uniref:Uncharacterized protein n=1 Tax=uncultured Caudovirales phage TaxID=2100421 RepID=A0A6J5M8V5_9CAUD|nr:hypothetical protein UFOVP449_120 [uncultured Caudovirales phage]
MANKTPLFEQEQLVNRIKKLNEDLKKLQDNLIAGDQIQLELISEKNKKLKELQKQLKDNNKEIDKQVINFEELDDTLISIGNSIKSNSKQLEIQRDNFTKVKIVSESIAEELKSGAASNEKTQKQIIEMNRAYQSMHVSIANTNKEFAQGRISEEERISIIKNQSDAFLDVANAIDISKISSEELRSLLQDMKGEGTAFAKSMEQAKIQSQLLDDTMGNFSGIPAMGELNNLLKTNIRDTIAFKAAVFALGAALGKAAYDYFGAPIKAGMQADRERQQAEIDNIAAIAKLKKDAEFIPQQIQQERNEQAIDTQNEINRLTHDATFAAQKAANSFSASMKSAAAEFRAASKTALFGNKLGGVGYGAAQMQMAGIGAERVAEAMSAASAVTGKMPTAKVGADIAIMAQRTGQSADNIANISSMFQRTESVTAEVAMNLTEGMRQLADNAGISLGNLMQEVAENSKEALGYQIKSGKALAKQVAYAQSIGVNFGDIAKAGKSMVLNYKDSIKAEMQLSTLLGEQVDLSEVRAKFAEGDTKGAMEALKAQGLNPEDMDMFQQEALSQALGGMDLSSLQKIATKTGTTAEFGAGKAGAANQDFLQRSVGAQAALQSEQAQISADQAIIDAKLSQQIADAYLASPEYENYKKKQNIAAQEAETLAHKMQDAWLQTDAYKKSLEDSMKLDFVSGIKETFMSALAPALGGAATLLINKVIPKFGKFGKMAGPAAIGGPSSSAAPTAMAGAGGPAMSGAATSAASGFGGVLQSIAQGLRAFANPATLLGLAAITLALKILQPVIEALVPVMLKIAEVVGTVLVQALEKADPIIESIFNGISNVIKSIGSSISQVIVTITDSIARLTSLNAAQMLSVAGGITAMAAAVGAFGAGSIVNAIGKFFGGSVFDDLKDISAYASPINATATAVDALANAFGKLSSIDISALDKIPWGDMEDFAKEGGSFVIAQSANKSFNITEDTAKNIAAQYKKLEEIATNNATLLKISEAIERLLLIQTTGEKQKLQLVIDGKPVTRMIERRADDATGTSPTTRSR